MWVCEGFSLTLARNLLFYGNHPGAYFQGFLNCFIPLNFYFLMKWYRAHEEDPETYGSIDYMNQINLMIIMLCRSVVVSVKYATYSDEHMEVIRTVALSFDSIFKNLIYGRI